jgi:hypothetical protein
VCHRHYLNSEDELNEVTVACLEHLDQRIEAYELRGSGWIFEKIITADLVVSRYQPLRGASSWISTPAEINSKHAVVNVFNSDDKCFMWALLSALHPQENNSTQVIKYQQYQEDLDFEDINFPIAMDKKTFNRIRDKNPAVRFNIFVWNKEEVGEVLPFSLDSVDPNEEDTMFGSRTFQDWCLPASTRETGRNISADAAFVTFIRKNDWTTTFQTVNFKKQQSRNFQSVSGVMNSTLYARTVSMLNASALQLIKRNRTTPCLWWLTEYQHLECFKRYLDMPLIMETASTLDNILSQSFMETINQVGGDIKATIMEQDHPLEWTEGQQKEFSRATTCYICQEPFKRGDVKVPDHDHLLPGINYRGPAHQATCNVNFNLKNMKIPVILHNFKGYDSKLILRDIGRLDPNIARKVNVLAQNMEQFKSMSMDKIKIMDSCCHLPSSLENLVKAQTDKMEQPREVFPHMSGGFPEDQQFNMLLRKGIFPYGFMDGPESLTTTTLPGKWEDITDEDYQHARTVWNTFKMETFQDYMELYLKTDVLLLADVLVNYQQMTKKHYGLDPFWFLTAPSLSLSAALRMTQIKLELLTDVDMYNFVCKSVRGGLSYICQRKAVADNTEINPSATESNYITYWDANNLYGWAMMKPMPLGGYRWMDATEWTDELGERIKTGASFQDVMDELDQRDVNFYLEVDATFPPNIHDWMSDYPMLPEKLAPPNGTTEKLINHLGPRRKYVLAYETYLLALQHGVHFSNIHRILRFQQSAWLKAYIEFNTQERQKAKNKFQQDYFKLMNNALFGKFLEDVTKYADFELFGPGKQKKFKNIHQQKPFLIQQEVVYHRCSNHEEDPESKLCMEDNACVVGMLKVKKKITLNKPIIIGSKILETSKVLMYDTYYNTFKPYFQGAMRLCATDTDSFIINLKTSNLRQDLRHLSQSFDFSNYPKEHELYDCRNARVPGKFKDEYPGVQIEKFVGLRSKCYAFKTALGNEEKRAKGVKKNVVKKDIRMEDYERVLETQRPITRRQQMIRSLKQQLYTIEQIKTALSAQDDKRFICEDGVTTLPWGHRDIPQD